jgi:signal transduction histidine kinase
VHEQSDRRSFERRQGEGALAAKLARAQARMRQLEKLSVVLGEAVSLDQVAAAAVAQGLEALGASSGLLAVLTPDEDELELIASSGVPPEHRQRWHRFPASGHSPLARAVRDGAPVFLESRDLAYRSDPAFARELDGLRASALAAVPVRANGRIAGAMGLAFQGDRVFDDEDRSFIATMAALCAQAILRSQLYASERLARRNAELSVERARRLQDLTVSLSIARDAREVMQVIVQLGLPALDANAGGVLSLSADGESLEYVSGAGLSDNFLDRWRSFPISAPVPAAEVVRTGEPVFIPSPAYWRARYALPEPDAMPARGAWAALPLRSGEGLYGVLMVSFPASHSFDDDERDFLISLSNLCSQALDRARLYDAALAANRIKSEFLATMSHELRTPLTAILGYTELLADGIVGPVTSLQRDHLKRVRTSGEHLLMLIQDLLTFSRLEAGKERVVVEQLSVARVVEDTIAMVRPMAERKRVALMSLMPDEPLTIKSDEAKVRQILLNLLANAVKFTDHGGVALRVLPRGDRVEFRVSDTGIGIPPEHLQHIFDAFWQVDQTTTRQAGGTGLGLSIARQLARLLGGDVHVTSESGAGSTFTAIIPRFAPHTLHQAD